MPYQIIPIRSFDERINDNVCASATQGPARNCSKPRFYAWILPDQAGDGCDTYIFGVQPGGLIVGGYGLPFCRESSDIYEDGVKIARFFLEAHDADEVRYHPPAIRDLWEDAWIHKQLFQKVWSG
jgi:hypothetical protein